MKSMAALTKELRERGIPFGEDATYADLAHRLETWLPGNGFLFRRMRVRRFAKQVFPEGVDVPVGAVVWVPNSDFARDLFKTKAMWFLGRKPYSESYTLLDVPMTKEYVEPVEKKAAESKKAAPKKKAPRKKKTLAEKVEEKVSENGGDGSADS